MTCFSHRFRGEKLGVLHGQGQCGKIAGLEVQESGSSASGSSGSNSFVHAISDIRINPRLNVTQELRLLCKIAEDLFQQKKPSSVDSYKPLPVKVAVDKKDATNLATLLLAMFKTVAGSKKSHLDVDWVLDILRIYESLLWHIQDAAPHVTYISRLFGPTDFAHSILNKSPIRVALSKVYTELSLHPSMCGKITYSAIAVKALVAVDKSILGGRDFDKCMPVYQALGGGVSADADNVTGISSINGKINSMDVIDSTEQISKKDLNWELLLGPKAIRSSTDLNVSTAVVHCCLWGLNEEESVLRIASQAAVKSLLSHVLKWSKQKQKQKAKNGTLQLEFSWLGIPEAIIVPAIRRGLRSSTDAAKRVFVTLLKHVVLTLGVEYPDLPIFHGDLASLIHIDPEQDFFENITHIQIHRRTKALARLRRSLDRNAAAFEGGKGGNDNNDKDKDTNSSSSDMRVAVIDDEDGDIEDAQNAQNMLVDVDSSRGVDSDSDIFSIRSASLVHVFLPMAYHHIFSSEFIKKDHQLLMQVSLSMSKSNLKRSISLYWCSVSYLMWSSALDS